MQALRLEIDVSIETDHWAVIADPEALGNKAILAAARHAGTVLKAGAEVSVLLTGDAQVRELNRIWRQQDKPTNVLSFPATPVAGLAKAPMLGDIVVAFETIEREALADGKALPDHLAHLLVHGFLHLLGYDHNNDDEAEIMENLERDILASISIADPYADKS
ncbi:MAG: rRNA maturation RNase YbeY [Bosea sp. (in: a-proteobacteria)]